MRTDDLLEPWYRCLPQLPLFDAHTHLGQDDPDGHHCSPPELCEALRRVGARAVVFPMHEPAGYPPANDRVLAAAASSEGMLVPFCRLDPAREPAAELQRCLAAGARGAKLHPRAERFTLDHPGVAELFAVADTHGIPVLIHAGRGIPALGRHALELCERFPRARIILAHAAICDLSWIWREAGAHPNLFFDTAWWNPVELLVLLSLVPPGQILFASDAPYGTPLSHALLLLRCALQVGLSDAQLRGVTGGQLERLLGGREPLDLGPAPGMSDNGCDLLLERVFTLLTAAFGTMLARRSPAEYLALARLACDVGSDTPQAPACRSVLALLDRFDAHAVDAPPEPGGRPAGGHLLLAASAIARAPAASLPSELDVPITERSTTVA